MNFYTKYHNKKNFPNKLFPKGFYLIKYPNIKYLIYSNYKYEQILFIELKLKSSKEYPIFHH
jgi:hypothetical protein